LNLFHKKYLFKFTKIKFFKKLKQHECFYFTHQNLISINLVKKQTWYQKPLVQSDQHKKLLS